MAHKPLPATLQLWIAARQKYHLSHAHIQMARELGLNPKKFGSLANQRQEPWKVPLAEFIAELYAKRFGKTRPDRVLPLEAWAVERARRRAAKRARGRATPDATHAARPDEGDL
jgi:hypothetical protein